MSPLPVPNFPLDMPSSELSYVLPQPDTRRARRAQREVDAALDLSGANSPDGAAFMDATPTGVVFSDEIG